MDWFSWGKKAPAQNDLGQTVPDTPGMIGKGSIGLNGSDAANRAALTNTPSMVVSGSSVLDQHITDREANPSIAKTFFRSWDDFAKQQQSQQPVQEVQKSAMLASMMNIPKLNLGDISNKPAPIPTYTAPQSNITAGSFKNTI